MTSKEDKCKCNSKCNSKCNGRSPFGFAQGRLFGDDKLEKQVQQQRRLQQRFIVLVRLRWRLGRLGFVGVR